MTTLTHKLKRLASARDKLFDTLAHESKRSYESLVRKIVWKAPHIFITWAVYRVLALATSGEYGKEHPDKVTVFDALDRWDKQND